MTSTSGDILFNVGNGFDMRMTNGPSAGPVVSTGGSGTLTLQVTGDLTINGSTFSTVDGAMAVNTTGGIGTVWGASMWSTGVGSITLNAGGGVSLGHSNGRVQTNTGALSITASDLTLSSANTLQGLGTLLLQPASAGSTIALGTGATGSFTVDATEFGYIKDGFSRITIGRSDGTGTMDVRALSVNDPLVLRVPGSGGNIALNGALAMASNALTLTAGGDVTGTGNISLDAADLTVDVGGSGGVGYSGNFIGSANFLKSGLGFFLLAGSNTAFTGNATVNAGVLKVSNVNALGTAAGGTTVASGATLWLDGVTVADNISLAGAGSEAAGALLVSNTAGTTGILSVADNATIHGDQTGTDVLNLGAVSLAAGKSLTVGGGETLNITIGTITAADSATALTINTLGTLNLGAVGTTGSRIGAVSIDSAASTLNGIASASTIAASSSGNLTVAGNISTTDTSASAIVLNAGKNAAAGTSSGGNLIISSGTVATGAGGRATLYSGALAETSLATLVGSGSGHFRYNSDEAVSNYTAELGSGIFAIYREQPVLSVTPGATTMTYGAGLPAVVASYAGYVNGDATSDVVSGTATWSAGGAMSAAGHYLAGGHDLAYVSGLASALGYALSNNAASANELTVSKAPLSVTAIGVSKAYDGLVYSGGNGVVYGGFATGETEAVLGGTLGYGGGSQGAVNAGNYAITPQGLTSANYQLSFVDGVLAVGKAPLLITANDAARVHDGVAYFGGNGVVYSGFVTGETAAVLGGTLGYGGGSQGAVNAGNYAITPQGLTAANYQLSFVDGTLAISPAAPAPLTPPPQPAAAAASLSDPASGRSQASVALQQTMLADAASPASASTSSTAPAATADATQQATPTTEGKSADATPAEGKTVEATVSESKESDSKSEKKDEAKSDTPAATKKAKVLDGIMVRPPVVSGFKRAYIVLLENADGSTGKIIVSGAKGEQVVESAGFGVPLDGSALPQKVSSDLMKQDFAGAQKALPKSPQR
jgi:hypothetical protein